MSIIGSYFLLCTSQKRLNGFLGLVIVKNGDLGDTDTDLEEMVLGTSAGADPLIRVGRTLLKQRPAN